MNLTVDELLTRMSSYELSEWMAFYQIEPWGEERADLRAGIVASTMANVFRSKDSKSYKPDDFLPQFDRHREETTWQQMKNTLMNAFGG